MILIEELLAALADAEEHSGIRFSSRSRDGTTEWYRGWRFISRGIVFHLSLSQLFKTFRCQIDLLIQRVETFILNHRGLQAHLFCIRRATVHGVTSERIAFLVVRSPPVLARPQD
ncbi:hypothetical protein ACLB1M_23965 [Escherichia coli]